MGKNTGYGRTGHELLRQFDPARAFGALVESGRTLQGHLHGVLPLQDRDGEGAALRRCAAAASGAAGSAHRPGAGGGGGALCGGRLRAAVHRAVWGAGRRAAGGLRRDVPRHRRVDGYPPAAAVRHGRRGAGRRTGGGHDPAAAGHAAAFAETVGRGAGAAAQRLLPLAHRRVCV